MSILPLECSAAGSVSEDWQHPGSKPMPAPPTGSQSQVPQQPTPSCRPGEGGEQAARMPVCYTHTQTKTKSIEYTASIQVRLQGELPEPSDKNIKSETKGQTLGSNQDTHYKSD